mmetsp:Transcript_118387/g.379545  ORF Transcript_118387/g.379545 Transcript_118387/m.379545 type:complete len:265 (-) Transcript_118387:502-1296(-)
MYKPFNWRKCKAEISGIGSSLERRARLADSRSPACGLSRGGGGRQREASRRPTWCHRRQGGHEANLALQLVPVCLNDIAFVEHAPKGKIDLPHKRISLLHVLRREAAGRLPRADRLQVHAHEAIQGHDVKHFECPGEARDWLAVVGCQRLNCLPLDVVSFLEELPSDLGLPRVQVLGAVVRRHRQMPQSPGIVQRARQLTLQPVACRHCANCVAASAVHVLPILGLQLEGLCDGDREPEHHRRGPPQVLGQVLGHERAPPLIIL